jgi:predicted O-methyltransferase YrrM
MHHDLTDCEILIVDNFGCDNIKNFIAGWASSNVRYVRDTSNQGTAPAKNKVFEHAQGEWVFCMDSHVLLVEGAVTKLKQYISDNPDCMDLLQGPLLYDNLISGADSFTTIWSDGMWGQWHNINTDRTLEPYEIPAMGMGLFGCKRDAWLGFNPRFKGFGGEEGYIHEKYRKAGHKTICLPWLQWVHHFRPGNKPTDYVALHSDKIRNYAIGFQELGLDMFPLYEHFGEAEVMKYISELNPEQVYATACNAVDIGEHIPTLARLSSGKRVVEFGVRTGESTTGLLYGRPTALTSYDINPCGRIDELNEMAGVMAIPFNFQVGNSLDVVIEETDVLFIDTLHTEAQLSAELARHAPAVRECIVMHDTVTFGRTGEDGTGGLNRAIYLFLADNPDWYIETVYRNNNGLTVLRRTA